MAKFIKELDGPGLCKFISSLDFDGNTVQKILNECGDGNTFMMFNNLYFKEMGFSIRIRAQLVNLISSGIVPEGTLASDEALKPAPPGLMDGSSISGSSTTTLDGVEDTDLSKKLTGDSESTFPLPQLNGDLDKVLVEKPTSPLTLEDCSELQLGTTLSQMALDQGIDVSQTKKCFNSELSCLILLIILHPQITRIKKPDQDNLVERLACFFKKNTDLDSFLEKKPDHLQQPSLVVLGEPNELQQFFLLVDQSCISLGNDCEKAIFVLFSSFFTFSVNYPKLITPVFEFLEEVVYQISQPSPSTAAFIANLDSLKAGN